MTDRYIIGHEFPGIELCDYCMRPYGTRAHTGIIQVIPVRAMGNEVPLRLTVIAMMLYLYAVAPTHLGAAVLPQRRSLLDTVLLSWRFAFD